MATRKRFAHQSPNHRGEHPHLLGNTNEVNLSRLKSEYFHGSTGCTVSPGIVSINFISKERNKPPCSGS